MYLIQRRILAKMLSQTLFVFCFVGVIVTTTQVLNQVFRLIDASSNLLVALEMFAFLIPTITVTVLPLAFLIACINVHDRMDEDRETVILSGTGAHPAFILLPAGVLAAALSGLVLAISLYVEPWGNRMGSDIKNALTFDALKIIAGNGVLREVQPGLFIRGGGYDESGQIDGLFILDRRAADEEVSYVAERGAFFETEAGVILRLYDGSIQIRDADGQTVHKVRFGRYEAEPRTLFQEPSGQSYRPRQTTTAELVRMVAEEDNRQYTISSMRKELIRRWTDWLYPLVYFAIVAFLVLRTRPSREGARWRLPVAVLTGFVIKAGGLVLLGSAGTSGAAATASFAMPAGVVAGLLALAFLQATRGRRPRVRSPAGGPAPA
ncbi:MAG: LptF/LptG family permease [Paracoccaceae bacterium]